MEETPKGPQQVGPSSPEETPFPKVEAEADGLLFHQQAKAFLSGELKCFHGGNLAKDCLSCLLRLLGDSYQEGWNEGFDTAYNRQ